jgi:dienelactone hydrolase
VKKLNERRYYKEGAMRRLLMVLATLLLVSGGTGAVAAEHKVMGKNVEVRSEGVVMKGYLAVDEHIKGKRPGVLVVPEWWGLNDYARMRARMLAELGYVALAVDMYGDGRVAANPEEASKLSSELTKNLYVTRERFVAAMDFLKRQSDVDPARIAAIGYCMGGTIVLNMAGQGVDLKGVVSFHGSLGAVKPARPGDVKARILVLNGGADKLVTPEQIEKFKQEMKAAGAHFQFISYPGALHSFTNPEATELGKKFNMPVAYDAKADKESWNEMREFLRKALGK